MAKTWSWGEVAKRNKRDKGIGGILLSVEF